MIKVPLDKILFLDIETVPQIYNYNDVDEKGKALFESNVFRIIDFRSEILSINKF